MTDYTTNLQMELPDFDVPGWHDPVNDNFIIMDAAIKAATNIVANGVWKNSTAYIIGNKLIDQVDGTIWTCLVVHTSAAVPTSFAADRAAHPLNWGFTDTGVSFRGAWLTGVSYLVGDHIYDLTEHCTGICLISHISTVLRTDHAAGKWAMVYDAKADLETLASLGSISLISPNDDTMIVGNGTDWVGESGTTLRTSIGLGTLSTVNFATLGVGNASPQETLHVGAGTDAASDVNAIAIFTLAGVTAVSVRNSTADVEAVVRATATETAIGSSTNHGLRFITNGTNRALIDTSGNLTVTGTVTASSYRDSKTDFEEIEGALDTVCSLQGLYYTDKETKERRCGFVWEDFVKELPHLTVGKSIAYGNVVAVLVEAIKELAKEIGHGPTSLRSN